MEHQHKNLRTIWVKADTDRPVVQVIDQTQLPHRFVVQDIHNSGEAAAAIRQMIVRGAPLIGATAAYGIYLASYEAINENPETADRYFQTKVQLLQDSRPTAVNLFWAINEQLKAIEKGQNWQEKTELARQNADKIVEDDVLTCKQIGEQGLPIIEKIASSKGEKEPVNILTHCNAGLLGCIEWGTATSPIYQAHKKGIRVHVWVDETRPRNQGASLTAWELAQAGVPHTVVVDNTGGHLMQHGLVDMAIVGTDRTTRQGDVANKIGTYLKALAAKDNEIPFYVALPSTTIDWEIYDGLKEIPIEQRSPDEVRYIHGQASSGDLVKVLLTPQTSPAVNYGFDVTPARLITGLVTERGICEASERGLLKLFPEQK